MIAACYTVKDEADILEVSFRHMLAEGIDHIYTTDNMSVDGTREIMEDLAAETGRLTIVDDREPFYRQVYWMTILTDMARADGHEWVLASDADEFWYAVSGQTIAEALQTTTSNKLYARSFQHLDWETCQVEPKRLPKVAYRLIDGAQLHVGNHEVSIDGGEYGVLDLREIQYRSFEHFVHKTRSSAATLAPEQRALGVGSHHTGREHLTDEELRQEWEQMLAIPTVSNPIPSHLSSASSYLSTARSTT